MGAAVREGESLLNLVQQSKESQLDEVALTFCTLEVESDLKRGLLVKSNKPVTATWQLTSEEPPDFGTSAQPALSWVCIRNIWVERYSR